MAVGVNCPRCRCYNGPGERNCMRCGMWLPPRFLAKWITLLGGDRAIATKVLVALNVFVFLLEFLDGGVKTLGTPSSSTLLRFGAIFPGFAMEEPWRFVSACFVHIGILHLAMNMLALAELGRMGESLVGSARFVIAYIATGFFGFLLSTLWYQSQGGVVPTAGASGAIFGLDGLLIGDLFARKNPMWKDVLVRTVIQSFVFYFVMRTNQAAHLGGLATGFLIGIVFANEKRPWRRAGFLNVLALVLSLAALGCLVRPQFSPFWRALREAEQAREFERL